MKSVAANLSFISKTYSNNRTNIFLTSRSHTSSCGSGCSDHNHNHNHSQTHTHTHTHHSHVHNHSHDHHNNHTHEHTHEHHHEPQHESRHKHDTHHSQQNKNMQHSKSIFQLPPSGDAGKDLSKMSPISRLYCILEENRPLLRENYFNHEVISPPMLDWRKISKNKHDILHYPGPLHPKQNILASRDQKALPTYITRLISGYMYMKIDVESIPGIVDDIKTQLKQIQGLGRIYVGEDGINIQISTPAMYAQNAVDILKNVSSGIFSDLRIFKNEYVDIRENPPAFQTLIVKNYNTLNLGLDAHGRVQIESNLHSYSHLTASDWHENLGNAIESIDTLKSHGKIASDMDLLSPDQPSDVPLILDVRNEYEWELGSFKNALPIPVDAFRGTFASLESLLGLEQLSPDVLELQKQRVIESYQTIKDPIKRQKIIDDALESFAKLHVNSSQDIMPAIPGTAASGAQPQGSIDKNRPIYLYCTGGIRCVSTGAFLSSRGFTNVNVLEGGINSYLHHVRETDTNVIQTKAQIQTDIQVDTQSHFKSTSKHVLSLPPTSSLFIGSNIVFDNRMSISATTAVSNCQQCGTSSSKIINCSLSSCNTLVVSCPSCSTAYMNCCSVECASTLHDVNVLPHVQVMLERKRDIVEQMTLMEQKKLQQHQHQQDTSISPKWILPEPILYSPKKISVRSRIQNTPSRIVN